MLESIATRRTDGQLYGTVPEKANPGTAACLVGAFMTLLLLLAVAHGGTSSTVWGPALALYFAAALAWAYAQVREGMTGRITVPKVWVVWLLVAGGVVSVVIGAVGVRGQDQDSANPHQLMGWLLSLGLIFAYLGVGFAIARARAWVGRERGKTQVNPGAKRLRWARWVAMRLTRASGLLVLLAAMGVLALWGAGGLGDTSLLVVAIALLLAVVPFPALLSLLSEHAIGGLATKNSWVLTLTITVVSLMAVVGVFVLSALRGGGIAAAGILALVILAIAIASSTMLDIAIVLALVALVGVTPSQVDPPPNPAKAATQVLVALGDSYMSGEGADSYYEGTDQGRGNSCRRAPSAWAAKVGQQAPFDGLLFLACSGARSFNITATSPLTPTPSPQPGEKGLTQLQQFAQLKGAAAPALVVLSIGGNDAGFSTIGMTCLAPGDCDDPVPSSLWSEGNLDRVQNRLRQVYKEVATVFPDSPVAIIPYPDPIAEENVPCASADLSPKDVRFIERFLDALDGRIKITSAEYGFYYVDEMVTALKDKNLQLCGKNDSEKPGINFLGIRSVGGAADQRFNPARWYHNSLHPNERGHEAMKEAFESWLANNGGLAGLTQRSHTSKVPAHDETYSNVGDDCADYATDNDCESRSTDWTLRQAGLFLLTRGWLALLVTAGAWAFTVAWMGKLRRTQKIAF